MVSVYNDNYDMDGVSFRKHEKSAAREYELKKHERESCKEIRNRITSGAYKDSEEVREHLELLEDLMGKLKDIIKAEDGAGLSNLSLKRDFSKIRALYNDLSIVLDKLDGF